MTTLSQFENPMSNPDLLSADSHFAFGKNWIDYAQKIDKARIAQAAADLQRLSGRERLDGLSFLDIGCGSGLHSLAAIRLGAKRVVGVDIDVDSITASRSTLQRFAPGAMAHFEQVSVFEMTFERYGGYDLVYSWGVLHHTGDMYRALKTAAALVHPGGTLMVALYRKTLFCRVWRMVKRWYSSAAPSTQSQARQIYVWLVRLAFMLKGRDFTEHVSNYWKNRGMDFYNDVHDWMGGFPYESINSQQCHDLFTNLDFELEREFVRQPTLLHVGLLGSACDEYAFRRINTRDQGQRKH